MPETAQEVFSLHRMQKHEPVLRGIHGTYLFDIDSAGLLQLYLGDLTLRPS